jgi:very-short-patch-repair endonuclease
MDHGCLICKQSKGEEMIKQYCVNNNINYEPQKRFNNCRGKSKPLPFDFYLPKLNTCIEYDGKQHYDTRSKYYSKNLIKNDHIKTEYCINKGITLIRLINLNKNQLKIVSN